MITTFLKKIKNSKKKFKAVAKLVVPDAPDGSLPARLWCSAASELGRACRAKVNEALQLFFIPSTWILEMMSALDRKLSGIADQEEVYILAILTESAQKFAIAPQVLEAEAAAT